MADAAVDCGQQNKVDEIAFRRGRGTERTFTGRGAARSSSSSSELFILITFTFLALSTQRLTRSLAHSPKQAQAGILQGPTARAEFATKKGNFQAKAEATLS